jgi:site-specific DNA recombinase
MRFAIYCRKSTDTEEKQVLSLESQEQELLKLAERDNLNVVEIFKESMSAKEPGRPVFNKILAMVSEGRVDAILCWKIDRLTRNPIDGGQIQWMLQREKIKCIRTFEKNYYPSDNVMLINIEQAMATQYIRDLSTNVKRGNRAKLERGEWPSPAPIGYVNDKGTKTIKVDKKLAPYVIRAFQLYATGGYTLKDITNVLYNEGLRTKTGNKICKNQVHHFIRNKFYYGVMESGGKTYQGKHKPLISISLFTQANNVLHGRKHPRPKKHFYTARGFLTCANCGCALTGDTKKGFIYYYCTNGKGQCTQHKKYLRSEVVDNLISEVLSKVKFDKKLIEMSAKAYSEKNHIIEEDIVSILERLTNEAKLLLEKELILVEGLSSRIIREEVYRAKMKELGSKQEEIKQQIFEIQSKGKDSEITFEQIKNVFIHGYNAAHLYLDSSPEVKRDHLQNVLSNISIKDQKVVSYQFKSIFQVLANSPKNGDFHTMLAAWDDIRTEFTRVPYIENLKQAA